jgi:hypothetical protein
MGVQECRAARPELGVEDAPPFGIVEAIWAFLALRRWNTAERVVRAIA